MRIGWIKNHHQAVAPFARFKKKVETKPTKLFRNMRGALYIHVPFCLGQCRFCILYREYPSVPYGSFVNALIREMKKYRSFKPEVVYFGGGTPTLLPVKELGRALELIYEMEEAKETTIDIAIESTISEFDEKKAEELASLGINRISFGVQSFDNGKREILGRRTPESEVIEKLRVAKKYFGVISIDLLYDLPYGNTLLEDIKKAVELGLDGILVYPLVYNKTMSGYPHPSVEENESDFLKAVDYLSEHNYRHLSINHFSNGNDGFLYSEYFTHPERPLLGIGPGAGGHVKSYETFHIPGVRRYIGNPYAVEVSSIPEELFCGLRRISEVLTGETEVSLEIFPSSLQTAFREGWADFKGKSLKLLPKGLFWANTLVYLMSLDFLRSCISSAGQMGGEGEWKLSMLEV